MDRVHGFMLRMFASYPEPDGLVCTVGYILIVSLFRREA